MTTIPHGTLNPAQLVDHAGRLLYGERYASQLADDLGVEKRGIERIAKAAGEGRDYPLARAVAHDVMALLGERVGDLTDLAREAERTIETFGITRKA